MNTAEIVLVSLFWGFIAGAGVMYTYIARAKTELAIVKADLDRLIAAVQNRAAADAAKVKAAL